MDRKSPYRIIQRILEEMSRGRTIDSNILEEQVVGRHEMGNRELEEQKVNRDIEESQLEIRQYKLARRHGKYSSERSQEIIEHEMAGMRKAAPKEENYNCYWGASGEIGIWALEERARSLLGC